MKVVIDTNTLISGIFWGGTPLKILTHWQEKKFQLLVSQEILEEYFEVIERISENYDKSLPHKWISLIFENAILIKTESISTECRDIDDNKFLDCAKFGKSKVIVTGDKDLLVLKNIGKIEIYSAKEFLKTLEDA